MERGCGPGRAFKTDLKLTSILAPSWGFLEFEETWGHGPRKKEFSKKEAGSGHIWVGVASKRICGGPT